MALSPPAPPSPLFSDSSPNVVSLLVRLPHPQHELHEEQQPRNREESMNAALQTLEKEGALILHDCVSPDSLKECRTAVEPVIHALLSAAATAAAATGAAAATRATASPISAIEEAKIGANCTRTRPQIEGKEDKEKQRLFSCFDDAKVLSAEARRALGITRIAKIGTGKKNVHFDPYYFSSSPSPAAKNQPLQQRPAAAAATAAAPATPPTSSSSSRTSLHPHSAMEALAETAGIASVIRAYCGEEVTLAETGLSITRPGGEGLEWHADGREGECTVIMSVEDIGGRKGRLGVVRKSHLMLDRNESEDFDQELLEVVEREGGREGGMVWYAYRKGQPIVFDARTVHAAEGSKGEGGEEKEEGEGEGGREGWGEYRVILWWIYNGHG